MDKIKLCFPKRASEGLEFDLCYLTEVLVTNKLAEGIHGFLGGEWGYGCDFENDVFFIHHCCQGFCEDIDDKPSCESCKRSCMFEHKRTGIKVSWYKWIGRSMEFYPSKPNKEEWDMIFKECLDSIKYINDNKSVGGENGN